MYIYFNKNKVIDHSDGEQDAQMEVVEEQDGDSEEKETNRAVAGMQGVGVHF